MTSGGGRVPDHEQWLFRYLANNAGDVPTHYLIALLVAYNEHILKEGVARLPYPRTIHMIRSADIRQFDVEVVCGESILPQFSHGTGLNSNFRITYCWEFTNCKKCLDARGKTMSPHESVKLLSDALQNAMEALGIK